MSGFCTVRTGGSFIVDLCSGAAQLLQSCVTLAREAIILQSAASTFDLLFRITSIRPTEKSPEFSVVDARGSHPERVSYSFCTWTFQRSSFLALYQKDPDQTRILLIRVVVHVPFQTYSDLPL